VKELERFRALLDQSKDAIFLINATAMTVADANRTTGDMLNELTANLKGRYLPEMVEFDRDAPLEDLLAGEPAEEPGLAEGICHFKVSDGTWLPVEFTAKEVTFADEEYIVFVGRDISDRLRAEKEKEKIQTQLRQAQKMEAVGILSGGIAHDFNNILTIITGFAEIAYDSARTGQADADSLRQILDSAERAKWLVRQIMAFSRKQDPVLEALDLNEVIRETVALLVRTLPKMIQIQTTLPERLPQIQADPTQIEQVLLNMCFNAADAMPQGGKLIILTEQVELDRQYCSQELDVRPGQYVMLAISDTGQGMSEATREHIFDPFYTTKDVGKGTGLGLSTAYGIIKNHGGHIHCYSELGRGTVFRIYLPLLQGGAATTKRDNMARHEIELRGGETILLVDDEESLLRLGALTLKGMGYQVLTASSGEEALEAFGRHPRHPDLVVMDLGMPGMGGHKAMSAIRELNPKAKVIIASGYLSSGQPPQSVWEGASVLLAKPYTRVKLLTTIREVLDGD
jgi:PAS domain S-box-containing protein